jgi:lipopolysaccharide/colanic/teichoic acid biosynthesis glycosyltransferase
VSALRGRSYDPVKRTMDVVVAVAALVVLAPVLIGVALVVAVSMGRPVLFRQIRPGRHAQRFELVKFRTMRTGPGDDAERLTAVGRVLRSTSLDELPQLWSVLRGQMSLVGPRPLLVEYLDRYTPRQSRRHEVRPGITGLAQVAGRNRLDWDRRLELDVQYVERRSLSLDVQVLARTVASVARRDGVTAEGHATAARLDGQAEVV